MPSITDWITAIAGAFSALAIILLWRQTKYVAEQIELQTQQTKYLAEQIKLQTKQIKDDHDRSRRENAISQMTRFTDRLQQGTSAARKLVETLTLDQTRKLFDEEPFAISANEKTKSWISACLAQTGITLESNAIQGEQIHLSQPVVSAIRWKALSYLNGLEGVMAAWLHNVADRKMIAEQFGYLIDESRGHTALARLRAVAGGKTAYPAIAGFAEQLKADAERSSTGKELLNP